MGEKRIMQLHCFVDSHRLLDMKSDSEVTIKCPLCRTFYDIKSGENTLVMEIIKEEKGKVEKTQASIRAKY